MQVNFISNDSSNFNNINQLEPNFPSTLPQPSTLSNPFDSFNSFLPFPQILQPFFYRVNHLEGEITSLRAEIKALKEKENKPSEHKTTTDLSEEPSNVGRRTYQISKDFSKHIGCPVQGCRRKYSSKIAMRAHIRKNHREIQLN